MARTTQAEPPEKVRQPRPTIARMRELEVRKGELEVELGNERHSRLGYQKQRDEAREGQKELSKARTRAVELAVDLRVALTRETQPETPTQDAEPGFDLMQPGPIGGCMPVPMAQETSGVILGRLLEVLSAAQVHDWRDPNDRSLTGGYYRS